MDNSLDVARKWMESGRSDRAVPELKRALANDSDNAYVHALLCICLIDLGQGDEGVAHGHEAIRADPESSMSHYALAVALDHKGEVRKAREAIDEALRIDPEDSFYWAMKGQVELSARKWKDALEASNMSLALDPESVDAANIRAHALTQLGRSEEAGHELEQALARDPDNSYTHSNTGWRALQSGDISEAADHFREALRLDPENENARDGLLEALKARNPIYRWMMHFFLFLGRQSQQTVWIILVALFFLPRIFRSLAAQYPALAPVFIPLAVAGFGFIYLTWIVDPLFDAMLFLHPLGRHALKPRERLRATLVTVCFVLAIVSGFASLAFPPLLLLALGLAIHVIPISALLGVQGRRRTLALILLVGFTVLGVFAVTMGMLGMYSELDPVMGVAGFAGAAYFIGVFIMSIVTNQWAMDPRKN